MKIIIQMKDTDCGNWMQIDSLELPDSTPDDEVERIAENLLYDHGGTSKNYCYSIFKKSLGEGVS